jgi:hypothetical protein
MGSTIEMALGAFVAFGPAQPTPVKIKAKRGRKK